MRTLTARHFLSPPPLPGCRALRNRHALGLHRNAMHVNHHAISSLAEVRHGLDRMAPIVTAACALADCTIIVDPDQNFGDLVDAVTRFSAPPTP